MKKQEVTNLIKETIEKKLFEHKFKQEISEIYDSRQDLQSVMLVSMMEELSGREIPDPTVLDEGVWEKAKAMLAKIRLSKSTGASKQRDALEAAADKAANKKFGEMFAQLKKSPGFDKYPNNESAEEFVAITTGLGIMYQSVVEAHKDGLVETDTANDLISKIKGYADGLEGDLSYSYRYFNEDEDADADDVLEEEEDELNEAPKNVNKFINYNKSTKILDLMGKGEAKPKQVKFLKGKYDKLEAEFQARGGFDGMTNKEQDLLKMFRDKQDVFDGYNKAGEFVPRLDPDSPFQGSQPDPGGGGGGARPDGGAGDPGPDAPGLGTSEPLQQATQSFTGVGDIGGVQDLGKLYRQAGSVERLGQYLGGMGFLKSVAGFALPVAGIAGITALVAKRLMGKSREGSLKKLSRSIKGVDPSAQGTEAPAPAGAAGAAADAAAGAEAGADAGAAAGAAAGAGIAAAAGAGGEKYGQHVTKWIAAGEPDMDEWAKANRGRVYPVTRESDSYVTGSDPDGPGPHSGKLKPKALELAKAQLAWMQKNKPNSPDIKLLAKSVKDTENYDAEHGDAAKPAAAAAKPAAPAAKPAAPGATPEPPEEDEEEKKARDDYYASLEEQKRWQKIAGIIKG